MVGVTIAGGVDVGVDGEELEDDEEEVVDVDVDVFEVAEEVGDVVGVEGLVELVDVAGVLVEAGLLVAGGTGVVSKGFPLYAWRRCICLR